jgi:hypothetical protein
LLPLFSWSIFPSCKTKIKGEGFHQPPRTKTWPQVKEQWLSCARLWLIQSSFFLVSVYFSFSLKKQTARNAVPHQFNKIIPRMFCFLGFLAELLL